MHFRDRGRSVQLVRTTYDKDTKKPTTEIVGRLTRPKLEVGDELKSKLTKEEAAEVESFLSRAGRRESIDREFAAARFADTLNKVGEWLETADEESALSFAEEVQKPLAKLRKQLAKVATPAAS